MTDAVLAYVDALPKVELHLHLEGSVRPATLLALARRHGTAGVPQTIEELHDFYRFRDFEHFVQVYYAICDNLLDEADFALIVQELAADLATQNVSYAEVTFTPFNHTRRGVPAAAVFAGVEAGRIAAEAETGVKLRFCTDIPGEFGAEAGIETIKMALAHRTDSIISFGLGGPEIGFPRRSFADAFAIAKAEGLHSVPHAGETAGPESVRQALDHLGAERIGHGVRSLEDPQLMARLRDEGVALEVCPTSNVRLGVVDSLEEHPLPRLIEAGLTVTLNSDDPPMFETNLAQEYRAAVTSIGLSASAVAGLARAGVRSAFISESDKSDLLHRIDAVALPETDEHGAEEAGMGIEPTISDLQSGALPLGHPAEGGKPASKRVGGV